MWHHVDPLVSTVWGFAEQPELVHEGLHVDERVVIRLEYETYVVVRHRILHHEVGLVQYALVIGLLLQPETGGVSGLNLAATACAVQALKVYF